MGPFTKLVVRGPARRRWWPSLALAAALITVWLATPVRPHVESSRVAAVTIRPGESVESAARRAGASGGEAIGAARLLDAAGATGEIADGASLRAVLTSAAGEKPRLATLWIESREGRPLVVNRAYDGNFRLSGGPNDGHVVVTVAEGTIEGSLFDTAERMGADPALVGQAMALLAARLDFARDIRSGDRLRLVFTRKTDAAGETLETGALLYADVAAKAGGVRLYAFSHDGRTDYLDASGRSGRAPLLRTPVTQARITSGFGMRNHPILGYTRMHQGVDFAAPIGTPVIAAGDGIVVEARPWGGFGNWLRIRHDGGWQTGYAHLAAYAVGIGPGARVRQGDVVGYVGATGLATGPHLHYEVWLDGIRVDPARATSASASDIDQSAAPDFANQRARIDELVELAGLERSEPVGATQLTSLPAASLRGMGLRVRHL